MFPSIVIFGLPPETMVAQDDSSAGIAIAMTTAFTNVALFIRFWNIDKLILESPNLEIALLAATV